MSTAYDPYGPTPAADSDTTAGRVFTVTGQDWDSVVQGIADSAGDDETYEELVREDRIVFRYADEQGELTDEANVNGSRESIAGICSRERNVLGMMPHPERACEDLLGSSDGRDIFRSLTATLAAAK